VDTLVKYFEVGRLDQGIRCPIPDKIEYFEDLRSDRIVRSRSFSAPKNFVHQQSSEADVQLDENREVFLPKDAA
jgi:hypothetical protein